MQRAAFPGRKFYGFTTHGTKSQLFTVALILAATGSISCFGLTAEEAANSLLLSVPLMCCRFLPSCTGTLHPLIILTSHTLFQLQHLLSTYIYTQLNSASHFYLWLIVNALSAFCTQINNHFIITSLPGATHLGFLFWFGFVSFIKQGQHGSL